MIIHATVNKTVPQLDHPSQTPRAQSTRAVAQQYLIFAKSDTPTKGSDKPTNMDTLAHSTEVSTEEEKHHQELEPSRNTKDTTTAPSLEGSAGRSVQSSTHRVISSTDVASQGTVVIDFGDESFDCEVQMKYIVFVSMFTLKTNLSETNTDVAALRAACSDV